MIIIERQEDIDFLYKLREILAGWSGRPISGDERNELSRQFGDVLTRAILVSDPATVRIEKP